MGPSLQLIDYVIIVGYMAFAILVAAAPIIALTGRLVF